MPWSRPSRAACSFVVLDGTLGHQERSETEIEPETVVSSRDQCVLCCCPDLGREDSIVFCPKCGTKNEDSVARCGQCGFELKAASGQGKFKGTVMMTSGPGAAAQEPSPKKSALSAKLKGTMVGVAPPGTEEMSKAVAAAQKPTSQGSTTQKSAAPNSKLKGTMVGVAPPNLDALKEQQAQAIQAKGSDERVGTTATNPKLKGTMIGLAPPNMQAEIAAARALAAEQMEAQKSAATKAEPQRGGALPTDSAAKSPPSKLKGTMMGVAPPNMQAEIEAAKAKFLQEKQAEALAEPQDDQPPSDPVNPLGGTMVGTSPFLESDTPAPRMGAAPNEQPTTVSDGGANAFEQPHASPLEPVAYSYASHGGGSPIGMDEEDPIAAVPKKGSSTGPLMILIVLMLLAAAAIGALLLMKDGNTEEESPTSGSEATETTGQNEAVSPPE